jgi:hypothetical protein
MSKVARTDKDYITSILYDPENTDKNFVKRVKNPSVYPRMDWGKTEEGKPRVATHQMSYSEEDGIHYVYPNIIQDKETGELKLLDGKDAFDYALDNNEAIAFDDEDEALWFSKNYKKFWGH